MTLDYTRFDVTTLLDADIKQALKHFEGVELTYEERAFVLRLEAENDRRAEARVAGSNLDETWKGEPAMVQQFTRVRRERHGPCYICARDRLISGDVGVCETCSGTYKLGCDKRA